METLLLRRSRHGMPVSVANQHQVLIRKFNRRWHHRNPVGIILLGFRLGSDDVAWEFGGCTVACSQAILHSTLVSFESQCPCLGHRPSYVCLRGCNVVIRHSNGSGGKRVAAFLKSTKGPAKRSIRKSTIKWRPR